MLGANLGESSISESCGKVIFWKQGGARLHHHGLLGVGLQSSLFRRCAFFSSCSSLVVCHVVSGSFLSSSSSFLRVVEG